MVFRKRRFNIRRKRRVPRRRFSRRRPMTVGRVIRLIDAELKFNDIDLIFTDIGTPIGSIIHITDIDQGLEQSQRVGNWIKPVSWMGTITIRGSETAAPELTPKFRIALCCWKESQIGNGFAIASVMQDIAQPHQQYNIQNKGQFKVLWSRTGILSNQDDNPQFLKTFRFYVKPSLKTIYDDAVFKNNHLFMFAITDVAGASNPPQWSVSTRLRYTDS